jgi:ATP synthase protein I
MSDIKTLLKNKFWNLMDQVFQRMIRLQIMATMAVTIAAFALVGLHGGISAMAGGGAVIAGGLAASRMVTGNKQDKNAGTVLVKLLKAEAVKILVIVLVLGLVFKLYAGLIPWAMIVGLSAAALLSGAAIYSANETAGEKSNS